VGTHQQPRKDQGTADKYNQLAAFKGTADKYNQSAALEGTEDKYLQPISFLRRKADKM
jgi:hypothetical protein